MKKLIGLIMLIMMASFTFAAGNGQATTTAQSTQNSGESSMLMIENQIQNMETAQLRVHNEEQTELMQQTMNKIREQNRERLNQYTDLEIDMAEDDTITARGIGEKKFLGILPMQLRYEYQIKQDGTLTYQKQWYDNLFSLEEKI